MAQESSLINTRDKLNSHKHWEQYFDEESTVSLEYLEMTDQTKLLLISTEPKNANPNLNPVIIFPGWFSMIFHWSKVTRLISRHTKLYYWESREKSTSILPNKDVSMSIKRMSEDLETLFNFIPKSESLVTVSSSMGGTTLFDYLGTNNRLKPNLNIMIGPNAHFDTPPLITPILLRMPLSLISFSKKIVLWYTKKFRLDQENEPEQVEKYETAIKNAEPWKLRQSARECLDYNAWDILKNIHANTTVIGASSDKLHGAETTKKIAENLPNATYIDFESNFATHSKKMAKFVLEKTKQ